MIDTKFRMTRMAWLLLALMMIEVGLVVALRRLGWFGTGNLLQLLGSIFVIAIPFLLIGVMFFRDRFRISMKGLLITVGVFAVFMAINVKPLIDYRELRAGSMAMLECESSLDCEKYALGSEGRLIRSSIEAPKVWLPPWLTYFTREWSEVPCDQTVIEIGINKGSLEVLANEGARFERLESLALNTLVVDSKELKLLPKVCAECLNLNRLMLWNVQILPPGVLERIENLPSLFIFSSAIDDRLIAELVRCGRLESLSIHGTDFNDEHLKKLSEIKTLTGLRIQQSNITQAGVESFRKSNPTCQFTTDVVVDKEPESTSPDQ